MRRKYPFTALRAFEAAARTGSFAGAAEELFITRPAISKQIRLLEEDLDCILFHRNHAGAVLTGPGKELHAGLVQSFDLIAQTMDRVRSYTGGVNTLRILVEHDFAASWLAGSIGHFLVSHPGISVDIVAERNGVLRMDEDYNYRIFYGEPADADIEMLHGRELCRWIDLPLCAPNYLQDTDRSPEVVLKNAHLLHDRTSKPWSDWLTSMGIEDVIDIENGTVFNETALCLSAAVARTGIAIGDSFLAFEYIRDGTLVPPIPMGLRSHEAYILYRRRSTEQSGAERAFENWIVNALSNYMKDVERLLARLDVEIAS